jgi:hypothetical protein
MINVRHSGAIGDIIYSLPYLNYLYDKHKLKFSFYVGEHTLVKKSDDEYLWYKTDYYKDYLFEYSNYNIIKRLLLVQPFIIDVFPVENDLYYDIDLDDIRKIDWTRQHIIEIYMNIYNYTYDWHNFPFLFNIEKLEEYYDMIVCNRSFRYRKGDGDILWKNLLESFSEKKVFIGLEHEYEDFCERIGYIDYIKTNDMYEVATIINSCKFGVYNSTASVTIAQALNKKHYLETLGTFWESHSYMNHSSQVRF